VPNTIDELIKDIRAITNREDLDRVFQAAREREKQLRAQHTLEVAASLQVGDRVRTHGLSPQYLNGLEGAVERLPEGGLVAVKLDHPQLAKRYAAADGILRTNAGTLTVIPAGEPPRTTLTSSGAVITEIPIGEQTAGRPRRRK
jgi:preprotein translocase subunit YajC